ncbi:MAG TPA: hypothetical protein VHT53_02430 [Candidatus Elarobacter sp.]|jgi:hypothetical protein|nr:hypothetical protein [Candidatus Elarobacter sp.]
MDEQVIPLVAIVVTVGLPIGGWIIAMAFRHQERMEMLRRGIAPPPTWDRRAYKAWRRSGSPWPPPPGPGTTAQPGWAQPQPAAPPSQWGAGDDPQLALFKGIRVALVGLALTLGIGIAFGGYRGNPIILGGLIPLFVGVAQIIIAVLSGAQLPGVASRVTWMPPPPPSAPGPPPPPSSPGFGAAPPPPPWAQQPGRSHFEELSKPINPPDVR